MFTAVNKMISQCLDLGKWNKNNIIKLIDNKYQNLFMLSARVKDHDILSVVDLSCTQNIFQNSATLWKSTSNIYWKWILCQEIF